MRLSVIINAWADTNDLLPHCLQNFLPVCSDIVVVWSNHSNYGVEVPFKFDFVHPKVRYSRYEPNLNMTPHQNETTKRNYGLQKAMEVGSTHFLIADADEFYDQQEFEQEKLRVEEDGLNGLVCGLKVYFKYPTLWCEDHTLVPFIHKIVPGVAVGGYKHYPFAYDKEGNAHIDPTRRVIFTSGIEWSEIKMHHFSWCRKDMDMKINNSSAAKNLKRSTIYEDLNNAAPGMLNRFYRDTLKECDNKFNLPVYD